MFRKRQIIEQCINWLIALFDSILCYKTSFLPILLGFTNACVVSLRPQKSYHTTKQVQP